MNKGHQAKPTNRRHPEVDGHDQQTITAADVGAPSPRQLEQAERRQESGAGGEGSTPPANPGGNPGGGFGRPGGFGGGGAGGGVTRTTGELDAIAPIPAPPALWKEGDKVYRFPITFQVELIDR